MTMHAPKNLCINTDKVYDWIVGESNGSTSVDLDILPVALPENATNVRVDCILTDSNGVAIPLNSELDIVEIQPRKDVPLHVHGTPVTLQRVSFRKSLYVVLEVSGVDPADGSLFLITSEPVPFNFVETALLCAPVGTTLVVRVSDFSCSAVVTRNAAGEITGFAIEVFICQSIQTVAPITVELEAKPCAPRDELLEKCTVPVYPPQCPIVFPGRHKKEDK